MTSRVTKNVISLAAAFATLAGGCLSRGDGAGSQGDSFADNGDSPTPGTASAGGSEDSSTGASADESSTTAGETEADAESSESEMCEVGSVCRSIPAGWNGPIATVRNPADDFSPGCNPVFPETAFIGHNGLIADDATCECTCGEPVGVACPDTSTMTQFNNNVMNCIVQFPGDTHELSEGCNDIPYYDDAAFRVVVGETDLSASSCEPTATTNLSEPSWTERVTGCALGDVAPACEEGICVPEIDDGFTRACVWVDGDQPCPSSDFTIREVVYSDLEDSRACSACECGDAEGACAGEVVLRAGEGCSAGSPDSGADGECLYIETPARSVHFAYNTQDVACLPSEVGPTGEAAARGPITICCAP